MMMKGYRDKMRKQLEALDDDEPKRKTYGRQPPMARQMQKRQSNLPTNMIFFNDDTGETFPLNANGASQFLRKMGEPSVPENIDWVIDSLLKSSIDDIVDLNGYNIGISCECSYDPQGMSLEEMGITKSMIVRPTSRPPIHGGMPQQVQKSSMDEEEGMVICEIPPNSAFGCGAEYGGQLIGGKGVLLGKNPMDIMKLKKKQYFVPPRNEPGFNNTPHVAKMRDISAYTEQWESEE